ncbi:hypothetical protein K466DRAFT_602552 [Polyporus arcularius HHB13444]|uniref:Uncharacterized protein n=1 Tax=Polyporus arcularius HHB13444 TaxID=1314778 RepID=A0A5C3P2B9_9APHY|nr:hypothetical protein K466DRAFT_602552 [Polyporus arcularius HHB13444]
MGDSSYSDSGWEQGASGAHWRAQSNGKIVVYYPRKVAAPSRIAHLRGIRTRAVLDYYMLKTAKTRKVADAHSHKDETASSSFVSSNAERVASSVQSAQKPDEHRPTSPSAAFPARSIAAHQQLVSYPANSHRVTGQDHSHAYHSQLSTASTVAPAQNHSQSYHDQQHSGLYQTQQSSASTAAQAQDHNHSYQTQQPATSTASPAQNYGHSHQAQRPSPSTAAPAQNHGHSYQTQPTAAPAQNYGRSYQTQQSSTSTTAPVQNYSQSYRMQTSTVAPAQDYTQSYQAPSTATPAQYISHDGQPYQQPLSLPGQYANDLPGVQYQQSSSVHRQYPADGNIIQSCQSSASAHPTDIPVLFDGSHSSDRQTCGEQYRLSTCFNSGAVHGQLRGASATSHIQVSGGTVPWTESLLPSFGSSLANFDSLPQNPGYDVGAQEMAQYAH